MYYAKVVADSEAFGTRLTTLELNFPRFILAEFNTHRMLSRNSASSRAIPVKTRIEQIETNPFVPEAFTKNKRGMQADESLESYDDESAKEAWLRAATSALVEAKRLADLGVHKQHANRLLEPYAWHTVVMTATDTDNLFALRVHKDAQPEIYRVMEMARSAMNGSRPKSLPPGGWHLPYVREWDREHPDVKTTRDLVKLSVARCAAVSYERQNADKPLKDLFDRHDQMFTRGHMSPFEHQAMVMEPMITHGEMHWPPPFSPIYEVNNDPPHKIGHIDLVGYYSGNFRAPWWQYRKQLPGERVFHAS